jgi:hypothetical protein
MGGVRVGRHRHAVNVRADGLAAVLGPLMNGPGVRAAVLVDIDSGMVLGACAPRSDGVPPPEPESLGAAHAELMRLSLGLVGSSHPVGCELVVSHDARRHHVLRVVPDPHGDRLVLSVVVEGSRRVLWRTRRRLREVSTAALTAGPTMNRRPVAGAWTPVMTAVPPQAPRTFRRSGPVPWPAAATVVPGDPALAVLGGPGFSAGDGPANVPASPLATVPGSTDGMPGGIPRGRPDVVPAPRTGPTTAPTERGPAPPSALPPSRRG